MQIQPVYRHGAVPPNIDRRQPDRSSTLPPDIVRGIVESSRALGINPVDLATVISYETAGTFDPTKRGPTTQWGQHRGLIQFGEPQARQYGVNWDDPVGSQLGENGAVARYLRQAGVKPGMGLLDVYSAVNAGRVGRYNASDANNGGAPGTVRDKVEKQMADHRRKAMALLGGDYTPPPVEQMRQVGGSPMQQQQQGLLGMIGAPDTKRKTYKGLGEAIKASAADGSIWDTVAVGLNSMRGQFADPNINRAAEGRSQSREQERIANATAEWLRQNGREDLAGAIEGGMISGAQAFEMMQGPGPVEGKVVGDNLVNPYTGELIGNYAQPQENYQMITGETAAAYGLDPAKAYNVSPDGRVTEIGGNGVSVQIDMGNNGPKLGSLSTDYGYVLNPETGQPVIDPATGLPRAAPVPGSAAERDLAAQEAAREGMGTMTERQLNPTIDDIVTARDLAETGFGTTGMLSGLIKNIPILGQDAVDMQATVEAIGSGISLENLNQMRQNSPTGGALGNVSDKQSGLLAEAFGSLRNSQSKQQFLYNLARVENTLNDIVHGEGNGPARHDMTALRQRLRGGDQGASTQQAPAASGGRDFSTMTPAELSQVDLTSLSTTELQAYLEAAR